MAIAVSNVSVEELTVAYLTGEGKTQSEIAKALGMSQSAVSRILSDMVERGYLEEQPKYRFRDDSLDPEVKEAIEKKAALKELASMLNEVATRNGHARGPALRVFRITDAAIAKDSGSRFMAFTAQAAQYVRAILMRDSVQNCGVTWGFMLWDLSMAWRAMGMSSPWRSKRPIRFIPLSGDPLQDRRTQTSPAANLTSSTIAAEMAAIADGDEYRPPWLGLVPAYIPEQFRGSAVKVIDRLIDMVPEYKEIFGSRRQTGIASELDVILTSVGPAGNPLGFGRGRLLSSLGKRLDTLSSQIDGDIGGVLLPKRSASMSPLIRGIERRWKGLRREHLETCAGRAFREDPQIGRPGVVVLAIGSNRAEAILRAVELGLINHLITDQHLAKKLEELIVNQTVPGGT